MSWNDNPYYSPESHGLVTVGEIEWDNESYSFNLTVVWHHPETGRFFVESDSGCSCPSPFEGISSIDGLAVYDVKSAIAEIENMDNSSGYSGHGYKTQKAALICTLIGMA